MIGIVFLLALHWFSLNPATTAQTYVYESKQTNEHSVPLLQITPLTDTASNDVPAIRLDVVNNGASSLGWDREFSIFLTWHLIVDDVSVCPIVISQPQSDFKVSTERNRFVKIDPGERVSRVFFITSGFRRFEYGAGIVDSVHAQLGAWEQLVRFEVRKGARQLKIWVEYGEYQYGNACFQHYFGYPPDQVNLPLSISKSNELVLTRR
jgi:hypothetical protein